jgi:hypothetical protein
MTLMNFRLLAARAGVMTLVKTALFAMVLVALPGSVVAQPIEKRVFAESSGRIWGLKA